MKSMTGFGRAHFKLGEVSHRVELRSLNNRHLDVRLRLPWSDAETDARSVARVRESVARGRVEISVWEETSTSTGGLHLDEVLAGQLGAAVGRIADIVGCDLTAAAALVPPVSELLSARKVTPVSDELWVAMQEGLDEAL